MVSPSAVAKQLRVWFENGESGLERILERENVPEHLRDELRRHYALGAQGLAHILAELEE